MDIKEIREKRKKLASEIGQLITDFEEQTEVQLIAIDLDRIAHYSDEGDKISKLIVVRLLTQID